MLRCLRRGFISLKGREGSRAQKFSVSLALELYVQKSMEKRFTFPFRFCISFTLEIAKKMPEASNTELAITISLGVLSTGATYLMWKRDVKWREKEHHEELLRKEREHCEEKLKEEREYLQKLRQELDGEPELLEIIGFLKEEEPYTRTDSKKAPRCPLSGEDMRNLPAFLEQLGSQLKFNLISIEAIYDAFGDVIILCDNSKWMWRGEGKPKDDTYWGSYNELARAAKDEQARRNKNR